MVKYVLYAILIYIAYQFIFRLVIPVYMTTRKIKKGFREAQARAQEQAAKKQEWQEYRNQPSSSSQKPVGDYIDFEEVK
jgi:hypothetical protein